MSEEVKAIVEKYGANTGHFICEVGKNKICQSQLEEIIILVDEVKKYQWQLASTETNPKEDGYYLTIYRDSKWAEGHYVQKVCMFSLGNNCTGHIWDATCGEKIWRVKYWMPLPAGKNV